MTSINHNMPSKQNQSGFALLITIILVSVILSIGLSVLDLSIKQVRLSSNSASSEVAFHAANAGVECARYWRSEQENQFINGSNLTNISCFDAPNIPVVVPYTIPTLPPSSGRAYRSGGGVAYQYEYQFTWGTNLRRCTQINTIVARADLIGSGVTITDMDDLIDGYPGNVIFFCDAGSRCTAVSVKGYNRPCAASFGRGTVQREVLLQY